MKKSLLDRAVHDIKMQIHNISYGFHHDIAKHCVMMENNRLEVPDWLIENADKLSSYESKTRYGEDLVVTRRELVELQALADSYINAIVLETRSTVHPNSILETIIKQRKGLV